MYENFTNVNSKSCCFLTSLKKVVIYLIVRKPLYTDTEEKSIVDSIKSACEELRLEVEDRQIGKILELKEQLRQRMGVVVVGPSGSGLICLKNNKYTNLEK